MHIKKLIWNGHPEKFLGIAELYCKIWEEPPWNEDFWTVEKVMEDMQKELRKPNAVLLSAARDEIVVGFTWGYETTIVDLHKISEISVSRWRDIIGNKRSSYIDELAVAKSSRGQGIGHKLTERLIASLSNAGVDYITLRTDTMAKSARSVYQQAGFLELDLIDTKYPNRTYWLKTLV